MPELSISPSWLDAQKKRAMMIKCHFIQKKNKPQTNCSSASASLCDLRSGFTNHQTLSPSTASARTASPLTRHTEAKTISRFFARSMDRQRGVAHKQALNTGAEWARVNAAHSSGLITRVGHLDISSGFPDSLALMFGDSAAPFEFPTKRSSCHIRLFVCFLAAIPRCVYSEGKSQPYDTLYALRLSLCKCKCFLRDSGGDTISGTHCALWESKFYMLF